MHECADHLSFDPHWEKLQLGEGGSSRDPVQWGRERELYCGNELVPDSGVLTRGSLGVQGGQQSICAMLVEASASSSKSSLRSEQMEERREGKRAFPKVAELKQRWGRAWDKLSSLMGPEQMQSPC